MKSWDDINFEEMEEILLKAPVEEMLPFYKYYEIQEIFKGKTQEEIDSHGQARGPYCYSS